MHNLTKHIVEIWYVVLSLNGRVYALHDDNISFLLRSWEFLTKSMTELL